MIIEPGPVGHVCDMPWVAAGYGSTGHADGTVFVCDVCLRAFVSRPGVELFGPTSRWRRVRWWNRRLRRRIDGARDELVGG